MCMDSVFHTWSHEISPNMLIKHKWEIYANVYCKRLKCMRLREYTK